MSDELLESSRSLAFLIEDASNLPRVSRSVHQIAQQSEQMLKDGAAAAVPPNASTYKFLASQGVDAMDLDPSGLDLNNPVHPEDAHAPPGAPGPELDAWLESEQRRIIHDAILEANQLTYDDFNFQINKYERESWDKVRQRLLGAHLFDMGRYDVNAPVTGIPLMTNTNVPLPGAGALGAAPPGAAPAPHMLGRSAVMILSIFSLTFWLSKRIRFPLLLPHRHG